MSTATEILFEGKGVGAAWGVIQPAFITGDWKLAADMIRGIMAFLKHVDGLDWSTNAKLEMMIRQCGAAGEREEAREVLRQQHRQYKTGR